MLQLVLNKKTQFDDIGKIIKDTFVLDRKRMTMNHTYNSKTRRGGMGHMSKSSVGKNQSAFTYPKSTQNKYKKNQSIFNTKKEPQPNASKIEFSGSEQINSFKALDLSIKDAKEQSSRKLTEVQSSECEDKFIVLKREKKSTIKTTQNFDIYSEKTKSDIQTSSKELTETEKVVEGEYSINVTSIKKKKETVRRRVKTNYTRHEIDKIMEHKKNNILINLGSRMDSTNPENAELLRVQTNTTRDKTNRAFKRSNTVLSNRTKSIHAEAEEEENLQELKKDKNFRLSQLKAQLTVQSKDLSKDKNRSMGTSIDKRTMNTSILNNEGSKEQLHVDDSSLNRDKSMSDPVKKFKHRYKSDNVLGHMYTLDDDFDQLNKAILIEDFELVKELGQGKFGKVVQVRRKTTGDEFAVKLIRIMNELDKRDEANLNSECEIFKTISDRYVVKAFYW